MVGARSAIFAPMRGRRPDLRRRGARLRRTSRSRTRATTLAPWPRSARRSRARRSSTGARRRGRRAGRARAARAAASGSERQLPRVKIVDLRREAGYPLSAPLLAELGGIAERGGKAILLLNRRGVAPALHCRACGTTFRCPDCDVALVLHRDETTALPPLRPSEPVPQECPSAARSSWRGSGQGTQRLERELATRVPELELIRLDADTAAQPEELAAALRRFRDTDRAVLLGTQMVAKGHHFQAWSWPRSSTPTPASPARPARGGADVPARDAARRTQRPRRARAGAGADLPTGCEAARARRAPRRPALSRRRARAPARARLPAVPASGPDPRLRLRRRLP